jgi:hypothetical protein
VYYERIKESRFFYDILRKLSSEARKVIRGRQHELQLKLEQDRKAEKQLQQQRIAPHAVIKPTHRRNNSKDLLKTDKAGGDLVRGSNQSLTSIDAEISNIQLQQRQITEQLQINDRLLSSASLDPHEHELSTVVAISPIESAAASINSAAADQKSPDESNKHNKRSHVHMLKAQFRRHEVASIPIAEGAELASHSRKGTVKGDTKTYISVSVEGMQGGSSSTGHDNFNSQSPQSNQRPERRPDSGGRDSQITAMLSPSSSTDGKSHLRSIRQLNELASEVGTGLDIHSPKEAKRMARRIFESMLPWSAEHKGPTAVTEKESLSMEDFGKQHGALVGPWSF